MQKSGTANPISLKEVTSLTFFGEVGAPFCLKSNSTENFMCLMSKTEAIVMENKFLTLNYQNSINIERFRIPVPTFSPTKKIKADEQAIYDSAGLLQKRELMMDQLLLPNCSIPYIISHKTGFSPDDPDNPVLLAYLSSFGALILYHKVKNEDWEEVANISELRCSSLKLDLLTIKKFDDLKKTVSLLVFQEIEWCPTIFEDGIRLIVTKARNEFISFYSVRFNSSMAKAEVELKYSEKLESIKNCCFKWIVVKDQHFLIMSNENGAITFFNLSIEADGKFVALKKVSFVEASCKFVASSLTHELLDDGLLILATKSHSVEVFLFDFQGRYLSSSIKYIGLALTGIQRFQKLSYLFTSMDAKVYSLDFSINNHTVSCSDVIELETGIHPDRYSSHGLVISKNKALLFIVLYPQQNFDHLVLRQPLAINLFQISSINPHQLLLHNPTEKLTDYYDCVELVRFLGAKDDASLQPLEKMPYKIQTNKTFIYYLKIQLIVFNAKYTFYKRRSNMWTDSMSESIKIISSTVEVLTAYLILKSILARYSRTPSEVPEIALKSGKCLRNFISAYLKLQFPAEKKFIQIKLWPELETIVEKTAFLEKLKIPPERCLYCQEVIEKNELVCSNDHRFMRCSITKLQLPFFNVKYCRQCKRGAQTDEILNSVTFNNSDLTMCPICDVKF